MGSGSSVLWSFPPMPGAWQCCGKIHQERGIWVLGFGRDESPDGIKPFPGEGRWFSCRELTNPAGRPWEQAGSPEPPWACCRAGPSHGRHHLHPTCSLSFQLPPWKGGKAEALTSSSSSGVAPQSWGQEGSVSPDRLTPCSQAPQSTSPV